MSDLESPGFSPLGQIKPYSWQRSEFGGEMSCRPLPEDSSVPYYPQILPFQLQWVSNDGQTLECIPKEVEEQIVQEKINEADQLGVGDPDKAIEAYQTILLEHPFSALIPDILINMGKLSYLIGNYKIYHECFQLIIDNYSSSKNNQRILLDAIEKIPNYEKSQDILRILKQIIDNSDSSYNDKAQALFLLARFTSWSAPTLLLKERISILQRLIDEFGNSSYVPKALWELGYIYGEFDKEKGEYYYERVIKEFPKSPEAYEGLSHLGVIYKALGEDQKAIACFEEFLERLPPYSFDSDNFDIDYFRRRLSFVGEELSSYYIKAGATKKNIMLQNRIAEILGEHKLSTTEREHESLIQKKLDSFQNLQELGKQAFKHNDLDKAIKYLTESIAELKTIKVSLDFRNYLLDESVEMLGRAYLENKDYANSIKMFNEVIERNPDSYSNAVVTQDTYLQLAEAYWKLGRHNKATETLQKAKDRNTLPHYNRLYIEAFEDVFLRSRQQDFDVVYSSKDFTVKENRGCPDYSFGYYAYDNADTLIFAFKGDFVKEEQKLGERVMVFRDLNGVVYRFIDPVQTMVSNTMPLEIEELLPAEFSKGLEEITFSNKYPELEEQGGHYTAQDKSIVLYKGVGFDSMVHEIFHHWDLSLAVGTDGQNDGPGDVSQLFYGISWTPERIKRETPYEDFKQGRMDRHGFDKNDFARNYGLVNRLEDFATWSERYVVADLGGTDFRKDIRLQMIRGNFEPAIKYLFIRFLTPMNGREYGLSKNSPSLGFEEVRASLGEWIKRDPEQLFLNTDRDSISILNKIGRKWQSLGQSSPSK